MRVIGILGGMSWTSTLEYYRRLNQSVQRRLGGSHSAKLVLWSVDFDEHLAIHSERGWQGVASEAIDIARRLEAAGADFLIMAVNTLHRVAGEVEAAVGIPLLHIADAVGTEIRAAGLERVGLPGTRHTMNEEFYRRRLGERFGLEVLIPEADDRAEVDRIIFEELVVDRMLDSSREACLRVIDRLEASGAQGVVLGCTELPLLIEPEHARLPLFDTLAIHAEAAVERALT